MNYWDRLLEVYAQAPGFWALAYDIIRNELGLYRDVEKPTFDPPAVTREDFARQYGEAVDYMMATCGARLELPKGFLEKWAGTSGILPV